LSYHRGIIERKRRRAAGRRAPTRCAVRRPAARLGNETNERARNAVGRPQGGTAKRHGNPRALARPVERRGVEPRSLPCEGSVLPVELSPRARDAGVRSSSSHAPFLVSPLPSPPCSLDDHPPFLLGPSRSICAAGCEGIEPSRRSFGGSAVSMTRHPRAPPRRIELPSPDRQSGCLTRCIRGQTSAADGIRTRVIQING
jgi:hypothetical protein